MNLLYWIKHPAFYFEQYPVKKNFHIFLPERKLNAFISPHAAVVRDRFRKDTTCQVKQFSPFCN